MRRLALIIALALAAAPLAAQETLTVSHDGVTRAALIDAAPGVEDAPLLIALHGGIGSAGFARRRAAVGLSREGWVVAWPSADPEWNDGRRDASGELFTARDDVGFLRALVARLAEQGRVDPERVFVAGPSIGGMMALRMVCEAPDLVRGAAVAIAALPEDLDCPADGPPTPMLFIHGTADPIVPPEGGRIGGDSLLIRDRGEVEPIAETVAFFARRNGCDGVRETELADRDPDDGTLTLRREFQGCEAPLVHYVVLGGGHTWPGGGELRIGSLLVGETSGDFSATRVIEEFLTGLDAAPAP